MSITSNTTKVSGNQNKRKVLLLGIMFDDIIIVWVFFQLDTGWSYWQISDTSCGRSLISHSIMN